MTDKILSDNVQRLKNACAIKKSFFENFNNKDLDQLHEKIKKLRLTHGRIIYDLYSELEEVHRRMIAGGDDDALLIGISALRSIEDAVKCHIKCCEKKFFSSFEYSSEREDLTKTSEDKYIESQDLDKYLTGGNIIDIDFEKPVIVNFYANWCSYSKDFLGTWEDFTNSIVTNYPNLQFFSYDVGRDREKQQKVKDYFGVESYPSVVLFCHNGRQIIPFRGNRTLENLNKFVGEKLSRTESGQGL